MKNLIVTITLAGLLTFLLLSGCDNKSGQTYGQEISNTQITPLKQILSQPNEFKDKKVTVTGKIINECPTGCWFDIQQDTAAVHVDLNPSGFAIPQKTGNTVLVEGDVKVNDGQLEIIGTGVQFE